jgi:EAL domain-containing protein (putative c-di-GMP-specific phosphodiesterase class I)
MTSLHKVLPLRKSQRTSAKALKPLDKPEQTHDAPIDLVRRAIVKNTVELAYQPVVMANDPNRPAFYEGLIRVPDDDGEIVPAAAFIEQVEKNILGRMLDCCSLEKGIAELAAQPWLRLAVNASPLSIVDPLWQATLRNGIASDRTLAERLIVEVTETSPIDDMAAFAQQINEVRNKGVSFALDDFGAGYTSFRILKEVQFDIIKIDGQFIRNIHQDHDSQALAKSLIDIARHFDMLVVAEAVELSEEQAFLQDMGVDCMQGFLFGRPEMLPSWSDTLSLAARS